MRVQGIITEERWIGSVARPIDLPAVSPKFAVDVDLSTEMRCLPVAKAVKNSAVISMC
jgi:hypothetical protein